MEDANLSDDEAHKRDELLAFLGKASYTHLCLCLPIIWFPFCSMCYIKYDNSNVHILQFQKPSIHTSCIH